MIIFHRSIAVPGCVTTVNASEETTAAEATYAQSELEQHWELYMFLWVELRSTPCLAKPACS